MEADAVKDQKDQKLKLPEDTEEAEYFDIKTQS